MTTVLSISRAEAIALTGERSARWIQREETSRGGDAWAHVTRWFAERDALVFLDDTSDAEAQERLALEVVVHDLILLLGLIFDNDITPETRAEIAADIEKALRDKHSRSSLAARLYSEPFPDTADFDIAEKAALDANAVSLRALLKALQASQEAIRTTVLAWEAIPVSTFTDPHQKSLAREAYRDLGLFHDFALRAPEHPSGFLLEWLPTLHTPARVNHRRILMEWTKPFREQLHTEFTEEDWQRAACEQEDADYAQDIEAPQKPSAASKRQHRLYPGLLQEIESQKESIRALIASGDLSRAEDTAKSLVEFQLNTGEPKFAAMSLCDLARFAEETGRITTGLHFINLALATCPGDERSKIQYASLLRAGGKTNAALAEYETLLGATLEPKNDVVARNGYAECLRELGRTSEALDSYQETMAAHQNNVVARNGYAECLRELGRTNEALTWYQETMAAHPNNTVARNATASLLVQLNRHADALRMLPSGDPVTLQDWIAFHVRGMAYLRAGDLGAAQRLFEHGVSASLPTKYNAYFCSSLAFCHLRRRNPSKATEILADIGYGRLETAVNIIRVHAFGADGRITDCRNLLNEIGMPAKPLARELAEECRHRFIEQAPMKNEDWLFDGEFELLLAA